jgi:hypothetical protein
MEFDEFKEPEVISDYRPSNSPGASSCASFVVASNVAEAEEVYASLKKLLEEINETENRLQAEERSYES